MHHLSHQAFFIFLIILSITLIYLLAPILSPFLLGSLLAYLANPLVKRLEQKGLSHLLSVISIFICMLCILLALILMLIPLIQNQMTTLIDFLPKITTWVQQIALPWLKEIITTGNLKTTVAQALPKTSFIFSAILSSGYVMMTWIITIILTPVVMFYLLRDWDRILKNIKNLLPKTWQPTTVTLAKQCDAVLSGFFRGQLLVMLALCIIYGAGLSLVGLSIGLILGIIGGLLSIVPYLGSAFVVITASITALVQFGTWSSLLWVWVVFLIGQIIESFILTPYLIGERIGLHPVAVIFSIMAGGVLFGFFGVLLALPATAIIVVLIRFASERYRI